MSNIEKVEQSLKWKQSSVVCASRLGMDLKEYNDIKSQLLNPVKVKDTNETTISKKSNVLIERVTSSKMDLQNGIGYLEGILNTEPLSADEIIHKFKIDTTKWKLSQYWNKEKPGGGYFVSANILQKKDNEFAIDDAIDIVKQFVLSQDNPFYLLPDIRETNNKALFVYTSDKHIGAFVPKEAIYENDYNALTFEKRMHDLVLEILYMQKVYGTFSDIYILDMGDSLDGMNGTTTRGGHNLPQNMNNREAFETYLKVHKNFFDILIKEKVAANYHIYGVTEDNHSSDFGYFANRAIELYLNTRYPEINTQIFEKFIEHFVYGEHTFIITHGKDSEDLKHGLPLVLNDKVENLLNKYIKYHKIDTKYVHVIKGDLHQESSQLTSSFRYRNVLSMFGSSKWMMNNFSASCKGGCSMEIVEKNTHRIFPNTILFK